MILFAVIWVLLLLAMAFVFVLVAMAITDFIVPIIWVRKCRVMQAWSEFLSLFSAHLGAFILYVLFKILIAIAFGVIGCLATCLTCCVAALPYIGTVILLPLYVFHRSYSLYFLSQFSADFEVLAPAAPRRSVVPPEPPATPAPPTVTT